MKKIFSIIIVLIIIVLAGGLLYFTLHKNSVKIIDQNLVDISTWKTYKSAEFGFSIKYPPQYVINEDVVSTSTIPWTYRRLVTILRTEDKIPSMHFNFNIVSAQVSLQRQPVELAQGQVYHTIAEYQKSGTAAQMIQGTPNPDGEIVTVNGVQALVYHIPPGDVSDVSINSYFFIKDDLIYHISLNGDNSVEKAMLKSIVWQ